MSAEGGRSTPPRRWLRVGTERVVVAVVSVLLGGLTSFAQGILPDALRPFATPQEGGPS